MLRSLDFADWTLPGKNGLVGTNSGELFFTTDGMAWTPATINGLPTPSSLLATNSMAAIQSCSKRRMVVPRVGASPMLQGADYSRAGVEILGATSVIVVGKKISTNQAVAFVSYDATVASPAWIEISPAANGTLRGIAVTGAAAFRRGLDDPLQLVHVSASGARLNHSGFDLQARPACLCGVHFGRAA